MSIVPIPKAYSYLRFSTPQQMRGDSYRRQSVKAQKYAKAHDLLLDEMLSFEDLGVSAYRGKNAETGALGVFLDAVRAGEIAAGSFLLVEHLDRLSRDVARKAARVLEQIVDEGITLVTLNDETRYTADKLDREPLTFMMVILTFVRANEESVRKSAFTIANWEGKVINAAADPTQVLTARCPAWLTLDPDTRSFKKVPDRCLLVERIFQMMMDGQGLHRIAETFNKEGIETFGDTGTKRKATVWRRSYISKIAANPAVVGTMIPCTSTWINGKRKRVPRDPIPGYFPRVISDETFAQVQSIRDSARPAPRVVKLGLRNVFGGLATCHRCGGTMTRVSKGSQQKAGQPYLVCAKAKVGGGCKYEAVKLAALEESLWWNAPVLAGCVPSTSALAEEEVSALELRVSLKAASIQNLVEAITKEPSSALSSRLALEEGDFQRLRAELNVAMIQASSTRPLMFRRRLEELVGIVGTQNYPVEKANAILRQCFSRIVVDTDDGLLRFQWKHGGEVPVVYVYKPGVKVDHAFWVGPDGSMKPISEAFLTGSGVKK